jgi:hypothetical protein
MRFCQLRDGERDGGAPGLIACCVEMLAIDSELT